MRARGRQRLPTRHGLLCLAVAAAACGTPSVGTAGPAPSSTPATPTTVVGVAPGSSTTLRVVTPTTLPPATTVVENERCQPRTAGPGDRIVSGERITVVVPTGWDAHVGRPTNPVEPPSVPTPFLDAGNFVLPERTGSSGRGITETMGLNNVYIGLEEFAEDSVGTPLFSRHGLPCPVPADAFSTTRLLGGSPPGQAGAQAAFNEAGRAFSVYVVLGSYDNREALVPLVNRFLAGITIQPLG